MDHFALQTLVGNTAHTLRLVTSRNGVEETIISPGRETPLCGSGRTLIRAYWAGRHYGATGLSDLERVHADRAAGRPQRDETPGASLLQGRRLRAASLAAATDAASALLSAAP